jgi:hypothetical protein
MIALPPGLGEHVDEVLMRQQAASFVSGAEIWQKRARYCCIP